MKTLISSFSLKVAFVDMCNMKKKNKVSFWNKKEIKPKNYFAFVRKNRSSLTSFSVTNTKESHLCQRYKQNCPGLWDIPL